MLLILLLFPLCSVIWMLLYLLKKKKKAPSFPFVSFFHFLHHQVLRKSALTLCWTPANIHSSFTRRQLLPIFLAYHQWAMSNLFSCLLKSPISYQEELRFTQKILHIFPGKQVFTASLRDLWIQFYFLLIGPPASSTTTNTVLPG